MIKTRNNICFICEKGELRGSGNIKRYRCVDDIKISRYMHKKCHDRYFKLVLLTDSDYSLKEDNRHAG